MVLVESRVAMSRKEGRFLGSLCQHAFIILVMIEGIPLGVGILYPSFTCSVCVCVCVCGT